VSKHRFFWLSGLALIAQVPAMAGNCGSGAGAGVGNPHCSGGPRAPVSQQAGVQPATATQPPARLGTIEPDHHNTVLVPTAVAPVAQQTPTAVPQPGATPMQVPTPIPQATPSQVPQTVAQPMRVPQQVPTSTPQATPHQVPQAVAQPMRVPQQVPTPTPQATPSQVPQTVAPPMLAPRQVPTPTPQATPPQVPQPVAQPMRVPQQVATAVPPIVQHTPVPQPVASTANPAGWFYVAPSTQTPSGFASKPMPYSSVSRAIGLVNPDGSLTQYALGKGWVRLPPVATPALQPQPPQPGPLQAPQRVAQPIQVPQQVPIPTPQATPSLLQQSVAQPAQVPTQAHGSVPQVAGVSTSTTGGGVGLTPGVAHRNALVVHAPDTPRPVTSGALTADGIYSLEFIEPGLQRRTVKVYRTRDAAEMLYQDTIPLDRGGFQLIVIGTRNPSYIH
jgi:hypothetical protein